jgi:hypothetical protein
MKIVFLDRNDSEAYLKWKKKVELIFCYHHYYKEKKVNFVVIEFTNYANMVGSNYFGLKNKLRDP